MRVLFFGSYDVTTHPRVLVLREGLRARGAEVAELNAPLGLPTADRVAILRSPARAPLLVARVLRSWLRLLRGAPRARRGRPDVVVVGYLGVFDVLLARLLFRRATVVLDQLVSLSGTAVDRGEAGASRKVRLLAALDRRALAATDVPVVDTREHAEVLPAEHRPRAVVVPVGAPEAWFVPAPGEAAGGRLRVVFFGLFTPLQGAPHIARAVGLLADDERISFTLCGSGQDLAEARSLAAANPRVTWREWVPAAELPALTAAHDVCLGILGTGDKARRVVPNKVFQGAAAGCAVVTSDTPPQREMLGDAAVYVPPGDAGALAAALRDLAGDPDRLRAARKAAHAHAQTAFRPEAVVAPLWERLAP